MIGIRIPGADSANRRTNDLYWKSDRTVEDITADVGMSRHALYSAIQPVSAGDSCPSCGGRLVYTTRTNRASHLATCESCGDTTRLAEAGSDSSPSRDFLNRRFGFSWLRIPTRRVLMMGGAAVMGAMLGVAAVCAVREG